MLRAFSPNENWNLHNSPLVYHSKSRFSEKLFNIPGSVIPLVHATKLEEDGQTTNGIVAFEGHEAFPIFDKSLPHTPERTKTLWKKVEGAYTNNVIEILSET